MRRRILLAIIGVTTLATAVLTVPLGIIIAHRDSDTSSRELERIAERTAAELPTRLGAGETIHLPEAERAISIAVYDSGGTLIAGRGPRVPDKQTAEPTVLTKYGVVGDTQIVTRPITFNERRIGVVRVAEATSETTRRVRADVLALLAIDVGAIFVAAVVGSALAARLVEPLMAIRDEAVHLGHGDFSIHPVTSGVAELDETAHALVETARRLNTSMRREREFTTNSSHQLRTPLAGLRLTLESEIMAPRDDHTAVLEEAMEDVVRLESTIQTLLALARDRPLRREQLDVAALGARLRTQWVERFSSHDRRFTVDITDEPAAHVSAEVLDQVLNVLIDNALAHGRGSVSVSIGSRGPNLAVAVSDEGVIRRDPLDLFVRRHPHAQHHGVGLSLARTLAEAEGGRLTLSETQPTTFLLLLPDVDPG